MSARRRTIKTRGWWKKRFPLKAISYIFLILIPLFVFVYFNMMHKVWNGKDKVAVVSQNQSGEVYIMVFDPIVSEIVLLTIPAETEVEVAKNLGVWKLGSVWELGKSQGFNGQLLTRTLAKHFKFPVFIWADYPAIGFFKDSIFDILSAMFFPYSTNLTLADKIGLGLFSLNVKNPKRFELSLKDSGYIKKSVLSDGSEGYVIKGPMPQNLGVYFVDGEVAETGFRVGIKDATDVAGVAESVAAVLETLGGKVTSIERADLGKRNEAELLGCELRGKNAIAAKVAQILPCTLIFEETKGKIDLEVKIGKLFLNEY